MLSIWIYVESDKLGVEYCNLPQISASHGFESLYHGFGPFYHVSESANLLFVNSYTVLYMVLW